MIAEGVKFRTNANVGVNVSVDELEARIRCDSARRRLDSSARSARSRTRVEWHLFRDAVPALQNKRCEGDTIPDSEFISAKDKNVVIIGGGDTGADCLGTAHRQGARSVVQFELLPKPPAERAADNPWPNWPNIFRTSSAHEEGGDREYAVLTKSFTGEWPRSKAECRARGVRERPRT